MDQLFYGLTKSNSQILKKDLIRLPTRCTRHLPGRQGQREVGLGYVCRCWRILDKAEKVHKKKGGRVDTVKVKDARPAISTADG